MKSTNSMFLILMFVSSILAQCYQYKDCPQCSSHKECGWCDNGNYKGCWDVSQKNENWPKKGAFSGPINPMVKCASLSWNYGECGMTKLEEGEPYNSKFRKWISFTTIGGGEQGSIIRFVYPVIDASQGNQIRVTGDFGQTQTLYASQLTPKVNINRYQWKASPGTWTTDLVLDKSNNLTTGNLYLGVFCGNSATFTITVYSPPLEVEDWRNS